MERVDPRLPFVLVAALVPVVPVGVQVPGVEYFSVVWVPVAQLLVVVRQRLREDLPQVQQPHVRVVQRLEQVDYHDDPVGRRHQLVGEGVQTALGVAARLLCLRGVFRGLLVVVVLGLVPVRLHDVVVEKPFLVAEWQVVVDRFQVGQLLVGHLDALVFDLH